MKTLATVTAIATVLLGVSVSAPAARIVCWTNSDGVRECGNSVPPEYAQKGVERKSKQGITVQRTSRAKTAEERAALRAEREKARKEEAERKRAAAQKAQYDRVLLATFTTEEDMALTRDGKIAAIDSRIKHSRQVGKKLQQTLKELEEEAAMMERGGKTVSDQLQARISEVRTQIAENGDDIRRRQQEKVQLNERFETDLARYRELKGTSAN